MDRLAPRLGAERRPLRRRPRRPWPGSRQPSSCHHARLRRRCLPRRGDAGRWGASALERRCRTAFLELHIEQGPVLERAGEPLGVVTAIAGQARGARRLRGSRRPRRDDADGRARRRARRGGAVRPARAASCARDGAVATVGARRGRAERRRTSCPARVTVSVDARAPTAEQLDELVAAIGFEPSLAARAGGDERRAVRDAVGAAARRAEARLRRGPRRDGARRGGRPDRDALRAQPERRREPLAGRADLATRTSRSRSTCSRRYALTADRSRGLSRTSLDRCVGQVSSMTDLLRALPEQAPSELAEVLAALDDRREVVARERAGLARER